MTETLRNKVRLKKLMHSHGKTSRHIANLLSTVTGDPLSARTVQSWGASPELVSARPCPGWVLYILENELQILAEEKTYDLSLQLAEFKRNYK
ncbi:MAG: hypothetical protein AAGB35_01955 [Pseudomonadota bacterium]